MMMKMMVMIDYGDSIVDVVYYDVDDVDVYGDMVDFSYFLCSATHL